MTFQKSRNKDHPSGDAKYVAWWVEDVHRTQMSATRKFFMPLCQHL